MFAQLINPRGKPRTRSPDEDGQDGTQNTTQASTEPGPGWVWGMVIQGESRKMKEER
jgi:hypothetical protein